MIQLLSPSGMQSNSIALPVVAPVVSPNEPQDVTAFKPQVVLQWSDQFGITGPGTRYDVYSGPLADARKGDFSTGSCQTAPPLINPLFGDGTVPAPGTGIYYLVSAQNQNGQTTWGSITRDIQISTSPNGCPLLFP